MEGGYSSWILERVIVGDVIRLRLGISTIGRLSTCTIRIQQSTYVSRVHAEIEVFEDDQTVEIRDLNSVNGIFVNNVQHCGSGTRLKNGDHIAIGVQVVDNDDINLNYPIYILRYMPIKRIGLLSNPLPAQQLLQQQDQQPACSTVYTNPTNGSQQRSVDKARISSLVGVTTQPASSSVSINPHLNNPTNEPIITISDDEDDDDNKKIQNTIKLPKIVDIKSICDVTTKTNPNDTTTIAKTAPTSVASSSTSSITNDKIKTPDLSVPTVSKTATADVHMPLIPLVKKEHIHTVSSEIRNIFGDADDMILDKVKDLNPYVYQELNGEPLRMEISKASKPLVNGDFISLCSDDENDDYNGNNKKEEHNLPMQMETEDDRNNVQTKSSSPNIFETSLNDSKDNEEISLDDNNVVGAKMKMVVPKETNNVNKDNVNEAFNDEDFLFSQVLINNMKEELATGDSCDDAIVDTDDEDVQAPPQVLPNKVHIKSEPLNEDVENPTIKATTPIPTASIAPTELDSTWIISDDDFDEELETKVTGWANKLFSQNAHANMSQVYDLQDSVDNDDDGDEEDQNDADVGQNLYSEEYYNEQLDSVEQFFDGIIESLREKHDMENKLPPTAIDEEVRAETSAAFESPLVLKRNRMCAKRILSTSTEDDDSDGTLYVKKNKLMESKEQKHKLEPTTKYDDKEKHTDNATAKAASVIIEKTPPQQQQQQQLHKTSATLKRPPPLVIDAPQLPKYKVKNRGVIAAIGTKTVTAIDIDKKFNTIREKLTHERITQDLNRKWHEKSNGGTCRREKEKITLIKESRKQRLRDLANKRVEGSTVAPRRTSSSDAAVADVAVTITKPKVKVTQNNRGTFLTEKQENVQIPKKPKHSYKVPKAKPIEPANEKPAVTQPPPIGPFEQELKKIDNTLLERRLSMSASSSSSTPANTTSTSVQPQRAQRRPTNKITFASMDKNFVESHENQRKLEVLSHIKQHSCLINSSDDANRIQPPRKTVRFNETPIIHYIERVGGTKKVDRKDVLPLTCYKDRRLLVRRAYPMLDRTDRIISLILMWSNEWLIKRNAEADAATDLILPMPNQFSSFEHYKSIMFPLMRMEFVSMLDREYHTTANKKASPKTFNVTIEDVIEKMDRLMLITKFKFTNKIQSDATRCDLVILDFDPRKCLRTFAYVSAHRKGVGTCNTIVFEISSNCFGKKYLQTIKEIVVRPVVDNVRVEFGAFNAVYQLEATPLLDKILNPLELLKCKPTLAVKKKITYKGPDHLNEEQRQAVIGVYSKIIDEQTPTITLIQGPPGTGKSCVITNLALQTLYGNEVRCMDKKILICAQSNGAVDVIAERFYNISQKMRAEIRFRVIRYGILSRISKKVETIALQKIIERDQIKKLQIYNKNLSLDNKEVLKHQIKALQAEIDEAMKDNSIKGTVQEDEVLEKQRQLLLLRNIVTQNMRPEDERSIYTWYLNNANIVCVTLSSCVKLSQFVNYFDVCIIDEATQCIEPWTLLPLKFGINSLILVGDTQQLPATILSKKANDYGLGTSLFTRIQCCIETANKSTGFVTPDGLIFSLKTQYRMHPEISKWPNSYFYKNTLVNGPNTLQYKIPLVPFSILNLTYTQNEHCAKGKIANELEAEFVAKLLKALDGFIPLTYNTYGVITPYAQHRDTLAAAIKSKGLTNVMVNTIDSYQGVEKDVIIISNARTNGIGFLANYQRLNVALTRPKKLLILCGNFKHLESVPAWRSLLNNARERKLYHEISAANIEEDIQRNVIDKLKVKPNKSTGFVTPDGLIFRLKTQYRMHPEISKWPNSYFYKNTLVNGPNTLQYKIPLVPFSILNLTYTQNEHCAKGKIANKLEAEFVAKLLKVLDGFIPLTYNTYGVITPYAQHRDTLAAAIKSKGLTNVMVNTIDSYQGVEKDVIIISNARTNGIGFLANYQRLNVALTRPKKLLILCGNFKHLESVPAWRSLLNNARERKLYHEISAANIEEDIQRNVIDKLKVKR